MKFLIIAKNRPAQLPPQVVAGMLQAAWDYLNARRESGQIEAIYSIPGYGGVSISNFESHEELAAVLQEYPLAPVTDFEIHAISDFDQSLEGAIKQFQKMAEMAG